MIDPLILYGTKISMFTGKARSYLIKQGIPFEEVTPMTEHFVSNVQPVLKRRIIPVVEFADGLVVQDTSDIIDALEDAGLAQVSAYPSDPLAHLAGLIFELFGDEGLIRPAMHYRWNFPNEQSAFLRNGFGGFLSPDAPDEAFRKVDETMAKFRGFTGPLGITETTIPEIERAYKELLGLLNDHFARHPYLLGHAPTIGDYGMMCSLYAHLGRDPVPAAEMKNLAPKVHRWTERMNVPHDDLVDMPYYQPSENLPETLLPLLSYIGRYFVPEMVEQVSKAAEFLEAAGNPEPQTPCLINPAVSAIGVGSFRHGDAEMPTVIRPIRLYKLQRITDLFDRLPQGKRDEALTYLEPTGVAPLLTLKAPRRVERHNHQEVWGA